MRCVKRLKFLRLARVPWYSFKRLCSVFIASILVYEVYDHEKGSVVKFAAKMSRLYAPTLKEDPAEAEIASHKLLLRAGMIRKTASGLYSYLPLAWASIRKIEEIIREEMEAIGAQEMLAPILTPAELWHKSGRWDVYGPELMRMSDRHDHEYALGPTHEETFCDLVQNELRSYKQLPVTLYHIQDKFRDELRPRFGLMRGREFIMKDGYSFCQNQESLKVCYDQEKDAYARIARRCGLKAVPVVADSGQIGGDTSVEFMALADAGEAGIIYCDACGYAADVEAATSNITPAEDTHTTLEKIHTPGCTTIDELAQTLSVSPSATRKALALVAEDGTPCVVFVPGDHALNDVKASHLFGAYHMMTDDELLEFGLVKGFIGPIGLPDGVRVVCDVSLKHTRSWICGANEAEYHMVGACMGRDFNCQEFADLIEVEANDPCPQCGRALAAARGIEISQVFQLGDKYSRAMGATFMDEDGREKPFIMGCYGIGVSRTLAAIIEQSHDEHGIIWPASVAPYEVEIISLEAHPGEVLHTAEALADELVQAGIDTILDDRNERAGVKFNDADLYGFPYQIICGKRSLEQGMVELKCRRTGDREMIPLDQIPSYLLERLNEERKGL